MERLIDANAFDKRIRLDVGSCEEELTEDFKDGISTVLEMMKTAPTVDAVPVRHGEWEKHKSIFICSCCLTGYKEQPTMMGKPLFEFCPVCGAKMDGKDGEQHGKK